MLGYNGYNFNYAGQHTRERQSLAEQDRINRFEKAWAAYNGKLTDPLKVEAGQPNDNVKPNYVRFIVNESVSFLFGKDVDFEYGEPDAVEEPTEEPEEEYLEAVWKANRKMSTLKKLGINGAVCGQPFIKIKPNAIASSDGVMLPRLIVLDPATVFVVWDYDDLDKVIRYIISYPATDSTGAPISYRQTIALNDDEQSWTITDEVWDEKLVARRREPVVTEWPWPFPPIIDCQNLPAPNEYWGFADIEPDVIDLQRSVNFVLSNTSRIIKHHAHPKTIIKGTMADQLDVAIDGVLCLPQTDMDAYNLEMQSDLASSIEFYKRVKEAMHQASETPEIATGKIESTGQLSGVALQILYGPLIAKTQTKRHLYGDMLNELNRRLLVMAGFENAEQTRIEWGEMLPQDALQKANLVSIALDKGIASLETASTELGYDYDLEQARKAAEAQMMVDSGMAPAAQQDAPQPAQTPMEDVNTEA